MCAYDLPAGLEAASSTPSTATVHARPVLVSMLAVRPISYSSNGSASGFGRLQGNDGS